MLLSVLWRTMNPYFLPFSMLWRTLLHNSQLLCQRENKSILPDIICENNELILPDICEVMNPYFLTLFVRTMSSPRFIHITRTSQYEVAAHACPSCLVLISPSYLHLSSLDGCIYILVQNSSVCLNVIIKIRAKFQII